MGFFFIFKNQAWTYIFVNFSRPLDQQKKYKIILVCTFILCALVASYGKNDIVVIQCICLQVLKRRVIQNLMNEILLKKLNL